jgi:hypothetical protein
VEGDTLGLSQRVECTLRTLHILFTHYIHTYNIMADSYYENASHPRESHDSIRNSVNSNGDQSYSQQQQQYDQSAHGRQSSDNGQGQYGNGYGGTPVKMEPGVTPVKQEYGAGAGSSAVKQSVKKALTSWVGFSNLPNQVHRRSVR